MNRSFVLKFSGISNLSDARFAAGAWADIVGFNFNPSHPQYIEPHQAKAIISWLMGPTIVAEFEHQPLSWIQDICSELGINTIQIPYNHQDLDALKNLNYQLIGVFDQSDTIPDGFEMAICQNISDYSKLQEHLNTLLNTTEHFEPESMDGVCIHGEREDKPGTRNHEAWNTLIEAWEPLQ